MNSPVRPLLRYELTDRVRFSMQTAADLGPFGLLEEIEGREEDILSLPGRGGGSVRIHPNLFHAVLEGTGGPWQVVREADRLRVLLADGGRTGDEDLMARLRQATAAAGARDLSIIVEHVASIPRTRLGKAPLIRNHTGRAEAR